ncbi:ABC transporter permease [Orrella sp. 11846]|uniref:ABC transporter permease n=1 Tax=Orrella sp. 11846 TaxID=3409913 RepID=UPI003B5A3C7B
MKEQETNQVRGPLRVTLAVWNALFLREALERLFDMRAAWLWLLVEPLMQMAFYAWIWSVIRVRHIAGMPTAVWIVVGFLAFFLFRRTATQVTHAIDSNKALFAYRQVKPFDAALIRAFLEVVLMFIVGLVSMTVIAQFGFSFIPVDPLIVILAWGGLWLFAFGYGMIASVLMRLVPETKHLLSIAMMPLMIASGVVFPLNMVPEPYITWLMYNPVANGLEYARSGFGAYYHMVPGASMTYLWKCAVITFFVGLVLYRRFDQELVMR